VTIDDAGDAMYEYSYVETWSTDVVGMVRTLNDLACEGWQLVTMDDVDPTIGVNGLLATVRRRIVPLELPPERGEGWYVDPSGRYDKRFWNGRAWTFSVARVADKSTHRDPPTQLAPNPTLVARQ
jgi:hypothetical protein